MVDVDVYTLGCPEIGSTPSVPHRTDPGHGHFQA